MNDLLEKLELIYQRWLQIGEDIAQPDAMSDMKKFIKMSKDYKDLQAVVDAYKMPQPLSLMPACQFSLTSPA